MKRYLDVSGPRKVMSESKDTTGSKDSGKERNKGPCTSKGSPPLKTGMDIEDAGPSSSRETTFYEHMHDDCMDDTDDTETKGRLEWGLLKTKKFLSVYKENKDAMGTSRNKKKVWEKIANDLSTADKSTVTITGDQARDRFYTLKRKYHKYISESNKTGNKAPSFYLRKKCRKSFMMTQHLKPSVVSTSCGQRKLKIILEVKTPRTLKTLLKRR